jgi:hypothetical protein
MNVAMGIGALALQKIATATAYEHTAKGIEATKKWLHEGTKNKTLATTPIFLPPPNIANNLTEVLENTSKMNKHLSMLLESGNLHDYTRYGSYIGYRTVGGFSQPVALMAADNNQSDAPTILHSNDPLHTLEHYSVPSDQIRRRERKTIESIEKNQHKLVSGAISVKKRASRRKEATNNIFTVKE